MERNYLLLVSCVILLFISGSSCSKEKERFDKIILSKLPGKITYASNYGGHLQGITTDYDDFLFWSHTTQIVKTDLKGTILKIIDVPTHHGDLTFYRNKLYVAVNLGKFNEEPGLADSWIYIYDADDLSFIKKVPVPEVVHGAGGIAIHNNQAMVVGGLPNLPSYIKNIVYEYDLEFNLKKIHFLETGYTRLGIQTAAWFDGFWYFGCYESEQNPEGKVLKARISETGSLVLDDTYDMNMSHGIIGLEKDKFLCSNKSLDHMAMVVTLKH